MGFILYFDFANLLILTALLLSLVFRKRSDETHWKLYLSIVATVFLTTVFDILASLPMFSLGALLVLNTFYMLGRAGISLVFFFYAIVLSGKWANYRKRKWLVALSLIPFLYIVVILIVNFPTKLMFDYVEGPVYQRGILQPSIYFVGYVYCIASVVLVLLSKHRHGHMKVVASIIALVLQIAASLIQWAFIDLLVEMLATGLAAMILAIFVDRSEDYLDFMTGLPNSNAFVDDVGERISADNGFGITFAHLMNFSSYKHFFPYEECIANLRKMSKGLKDGGKKRENSSRAYYLGQGTFALLYGDASKGEEIAAFVDSFLNRCVESKTGKTFRVHAKVCQANCPGDFRDVPSLISFASTYYESIPSHESLLSIAPFRKEGEPNLLFALNRILDQAVEEDLFELYYQPIYSLKEKRFVTAEALLRLHSPAYGFISPSLFVPYAEKTGKMVQIGDMVLQKSFAFASSDEFKESGLEYLEVNLSVIQLADEGLVERIFALGKEYGINPKTINFEITESVAIDGDAVSERNILALSSAGYGIAIDDFGMGYSNISRLMSLPASLVKIDKSFVDLLASDSLVEPFSGFVTLIECLGAEVLLEGIETKDILDKAMGMDIDFIQGFYYSKALPGDEFFAFLKKENR